MYDQYDMSMMDSSLKMFTTTFLFIYLIVLVVLIVSMWKIFTKAGKPGWAAIIPIYNILVLLEIVGLPWWWILIILIGMFIPVINFLIMIGVGFYIDYLLAKSFGKDIGFAIGLLLLGIVFLPILAFGNAQYQGPAALGETNQPPREDIIE